MGGTHTKIPVVSTKVVEPPCGRQLDVIMTMLRSGSEPRSASELRARLHAGGKRLWRTLARLAQSCSRPSSALRPLIFSADLTSLLPKSSYALVSVIRVCMHPQASLVAAMPVPSL